MKKRHKVITDQKFPPTNEEMMNDSNLFIMKNVKRLTFTGSGRVKLLSNGHIQGAVPVMQKGGTLILECANRESNDDQVHNVGTINVVAASGAVSYNSNSIVSNGSISAGRIVSGKLAMTDNKVQWQGGYSAEKTHTGLKIEVPNTDILEVNGRRVRVEDIPMLRPIIVPEKTYCIQSSDVMAIQCTDRVKLFLQGFPGLSNSDLAIYANGQTNVIFDEDFVVDKLLIVTSGHAIVKPKHAVVGARTVTLLAGDYSTISNIACIGDSFVDATGNAKISFAVNDMQSMTNTQSGFGSSVPMHMTDQEVIRITELFSMVKPAEPAKEGHDDIDIVDLDTASTSQPAKKQRKGVN